MVSTAIAWGATVRGTYGTPEAGTRTQYVQCVMPGGQAALRLRYMYVPNAGARLVRVACTYPTEAPGVISGHVSAQGRTTGSCRESPPARTMSSVTPTMELQSAPW